MPEEAVKWAFHEGQWDAWESDARIRVGVSGRRWGKGVLGSRWVLAGAAEDDQNGVGGLSWVVAPTYKVLRVMWRLILKESPKGLIDSIVGTERMPDLIRIGTETIEFKSADDPENLVGVGLTRLLVDEAALLSERAWRESLRPTLMDHGAPAMLIGTPKGQNWFWREWQRGENPDIPDVMSFGGPSYENPYIAESEIDALAKELPERLFKQEIMGEFLSMEGALFRGVRNLIKEEPSHERTVSLGVDLGRQHDFTVLIGMDENGDWTHFDRFTGISWAVQKDRIKAAWENLGRSDIWMDSTGLGGPVVEELQRQGLPVTPYTFSHQSKADLVERLAHGVETGALSLPDRPVLVNELEAFEASKTRTGNIRYSAPQGGYDDCVIALALSYWGIKDTQLAAFFF